MKPVREGQGRLQDILIDFSRQLLQKQSELSTKVANVLDKL
jgi:hypothetical protein